LVIVSDGKNMGMEPLEAAAAIKKTYKDALCIYPIYVGDADDGVELMNQIAQIGGCGFATGADALLNGKKMADYVETLFLGDLIDSDGDGVPDVADQCPNTPSGVNVDEAGCPLDSDGDGVPDYLDKCPQTPPGAKVDSSGCPVTILGGSAASWSFDEVTFESGKAELSKSSFYLLDQIAVALNSDPRLRIRVEGHTDNTGSRELNMKLSKERAQAVAAYLIGRGISPARLSAEGFGPDRPIADNGTQEGRSQNRRVEFVKID
jgi:OOP family OmpA-OmpF porin